MIFDVTGRVLRTAGRLAWVFAPKCPTRLVRRTPIVSQANRQGGVAIFQANTNGLVVEHVAALLRRAGRLFRSGAGVLADAVYARPVRRALRVARALADLGRAGDLPALVHHEAVFADASGAVVRDLALLVAPALERGVATGVVALARGRVAGQTGGAVRVFAAARGGGGARLR